MAHHSNRKHDDNYVVTPIDAKKGFDKIQYLSMVKIIKKLSIEGMYFNTIKATYANTTANITLSGDKLKGFPLK